MGAADLEFARAARLLPIADVAAAIGLGAADLEPYGAHKAKVHADALERTREHPDGALVLVTGMTPTPAGEGKSTVTVGLGDALRRVGRRAAVAIREPSLGPIFGVKGGACGGGRAQVVPMEDINLHFTGDFHAVTSAHNLLAALLDNHVHQGNALGIDPRRVSWQRVLDMNDRALRHVVVGLGGPVHGVPRESGFEITAASEVMAVLCLATDPRDLEARLGRLVVGERADGAFVTAADLKAAGAMTMLLKDAIQPNLVQTLEGTPAFVHGGPFGNIAHGSNSLVATRLALKLADVVVTEAGFATELGAEKFFDIVCRAGGLVPSAAVVVATVRALKLHGGVGLDRLDVENVSAVRAGLDNLAKHVENIRQFGVPPVVALNRFTTDSAAEIDAVVAAGETVLSAPTVVARVWEQGGDGGLDLARAVLRTIADNGRAKFRPLYPDDVPLATKLETIARSLYGADDVVVLPAAATKLTRYQTSGFGHLPVCVAKTPSSLSDDPTKRGRPRGFTVTVRDVKLAAGAGYVVAYAGDILTMPGLPAHPAAEAMRLDEAGHIVGLF